MNYNYKKKNILNKLFLNFKKIIKIYYVRRWVTWRDSEPRLGSQTTTDVVGELIRMGSTAVRGVPARTPTLKSVSASRNVRKKEVST